eukprot:TRINITY_DN5375_c0_g1_i1.p1 TRINITY_DN5375_c0_g1~~TRINITY_DN5375_c0_g1_i1.p1  ORF type:complete len:125 (-),score=4.12 TRINITY_DN5375_c0_g1_i1:99-473(-)
MSSAKKQFTEIWQATAPELEFTLVEDTATNVITAADSVLLASGTVALECMLLKRPMVVGYKVNKLTGYIVKKLAITEFVSLPNILAGEEIVERAHSLKSATRTSCSHLSINAISRQQCIDRTFY